MTSSIDLFESFWTELKPDLINFLDVSWKSYKDIAAQDIEEFLTKSKEDIEGFFLLFQNGSISQDELDWLIKGEKDLMTLSGLRKAGLSQVALDSFSSGVIDLVLSSALKFVPTLL